MSLLEKIEDVRSRIKSGLYGNEAAVSQGIVIPLLRTLGWPTDDTQTVWPEYSLEGRRVDYALCHPSRKPIAFIEVKQIGQSAGAEKQLFEYAFHIGVPLAILTDGQEWNFFLPAEQGNYTERRVYKLDIVEREMSESVARLEKYLSHKRVVSGEAISAAREDYKNVSQSRQMLSTLPEAWSKLIDEEDEQLLELLADKVESLCGFKPDVDIVAQYLRNSTGVENINRIEKILEPSRPTRPNTSKIINKAQRSSQLVQRGSIGYWFKGRFVPCGSGRDVLISVLEELAEYDPSFLERFAARPKHGRTRRYIAASPNELYPDRPDLASEHHLKLKSGWYVGTNVGHVQIEKIIRMACEVSGTSFGEELTISMGK